MSAKIQYVHTNIVAKNWKMLADFYIKSFECRIKPPERDLSGEWLDALTGIKNVHIKGVHLELPGYKNGPTLEIFSYDPVCSSKCENERYQYPRASPGPGPMKRPIPQ